MVLDQTDMLTATEKAALDKWKAKHSLTCARANYVATSAVSGYGYRLRALCTACGTREDITDKSGRDPIPVK